ncbi:MAG: OpgC domain-containing protein [Pseudomonadota bacterium]
MNATAPSTNFTPSVSGTSGRTTRDPRLDFFRGLAMFIIFIAHTPRDFWALYIPARFGFSDATETFVFCSGMASALAFGAVFHKRGWLMGAARIAHRIWQVYWAHIGLFFAVLVLCVLMDRSGWFVSDYWSGSYVSSLNLKHFFTKTPELVTGIFTLTYVPNYFDILPMYLVILALIPCVMALEKVSLWAVAAFVGGLWLIANAHLLGLTAPNLPAEPWSERRWFFNPLGWQLVFFTGFAFMRGWIKPPKVSLSRVIIAALIVVVTIPVAYYRVRNGFPFLKELSADLKPLTGKTSFGILRYVHFLATAYLAWVAVGPMGARLKNWGRAQIVVDVIRKVGQQSLAVFISSLIIAQFIGACFKLFTPTATVVAIGNLAGFAALIAVAYTVAWFKSQPWRKPPQARETAPAAGPAVMPNPSLAKRMD